MKIGLLIKIAISLLLARWKQTLVAAVGVMFSITMFISLLGFMNGLNQLLDGLITNRTPHVRLYKEILPTKIQPIQEALNNDSTEAFVRSIKPKNERLDIHNGQNIIQTLKKDSRVKGVTPKAVTQVFYNSGTIQLNGTINGVDVENENRLFFFNDYVVKGNYLDLKNIPNSIILGKGVADILLIEVGDVINVTTIFGDIQPLKVVGFFQSGIADWDKIQSYCSIATTQKLLGKGIEFMTDINVKLNDMSIAKPMAKEYAEIFGIEAIDIKSANAQYDTGSDIRNMISYAVGITLLIVAGFGIYNILNMMIYEKMDSIAILKATGFSGRDVQTIFIIIALLIGVFGGGFGLIFGFGLSNIIDNTPFVTEALPTVNTFPVDYNIKYYIIGGSFSLITTYFAGYFPAKKASKIDPVSIIRGK